MPFAQRPEANDEGSSVAHGRTFAAAMVQRPIRLTLKIDDQEIAACGNQMLEVKIAVTADARGRYLFEMRPAKRNISSSPWRIRRAASCMASGNVFNRRRSRSSVLRI